MEVSQRDLAALAWSVALRQCEALLTWATKSLAKEKYGQGGSWKDELAVFLGNVTSVPFIRTMADSDHWDLNTIGQLWQNTTFLSDVLLPAMRLEPHDPAAEKLRDAADGLYQRRAELKMETPSLATARSNLGYLEELVGLLGKHLPASLEVFRDRQNAAQDRIKTCLAMVAQGSKDDGSVTVTNPELRWLLLHMSLQELNVSLKNHIIEAMGKSLLPSPKDLEADAQERKEKAEQDKREKDAQKNKKETKRDESKGGDANNKKKARQSNIPEKVKDLASLCQYLSACKLYSPKADSERPLIYGKSVNKVAKIKKIDQLLQLITKSRHQLYHPDAKTEKWIEDNLGKAMEAAVALLEGFSDVSDACKASAANLTSLKEQLGDLHDDGTPEDGPRHILNVLKWETDDDLGQLRIPFRVGQKLIGRESLTTSLAELLTKEHPLPEERRITLYGDPGTGKTVTAIEVVKEAEALKPEWRFAWLRGGTVDELQQGLDKFARTAVPSVQHDEKVDEALDKLKRWLVINDAAVLVIDDATEEALAYLESRVLSPGHGRVLMTGAKALSQISRKLEVFEANESVALIKQKFDGCFSAYPEVFHLSLEADGNGKRLTEFLSGDLVDNLPLTVDQVAQLLVARAKESGLGNKTLAEGDRRDKCRGLLETVIEEFSEAASAVDVSSLSVNDRHLRGLMGTVRLWVSRLRQLPDKELSEASLSLLQACSMLAKQGVPWSLLEAYAQARKSMEPKAEEHQGSVAAVESPADGSDGSSGVDDDSVADEDSDDQILRTAADEALELLERAVKTLDAFGRLVVVSGTAGEGRSASMHGSIQACLLQELGECCPGLREALTSRFHGNGVEFAERREMELWRPSVVSFLGHSSKACTTTSEDRQDIVVKDAKLRSSVGLLLEAQGLYWKAEPYLEKALRDRMEELGDRHPHTLVCIANLGGLHSSQGKYFKAEPLYVEALEVRRKELGDRHPHTLVSIANLGLLYWSQGKYSEAEPLHVEALEVRREELGDRHPDTLASIANLGLLYSGQGKYSEAEPLFVEALEGRRKELGDRHPHTLVSIAHLGGLYLSQGKYSEAEPLYVEALEVKRKELGDRHPNTLISISNLGGLYLSQGKYSEAEPLCVKALEGMRKELGDRHPNTLKSINNLGGLYKSQGKYSEAEPLLLEALGDRGRVVTFAAIICLRTICLCFKVVNAVLDMGRMVNISPRLAFPLATFPLIWLAYDSSNVLYSCLIIYTVCVVFSLSCLVFLFCGFLLLAILKD